jgi:ferredoxin-NADP reductase
MQVRVMEVLQLNPSIRAFRLTALDGSPLPGFTAGAYINVRVQLPDGNMDWRRYSLVNFSSEDSHAETVPHYQIAVRLEEAGRGGSRYMHQGIVQGDVLTIESPRNDFSLVKTTGRSVLIGGGIGITPMVTMAAAQLASRHPLVMHYAGRSRASMAYVQELQAMLGEQLHLHADDECQHPLDVARIIDGCAADDHVYVCGPQAMLDAVLAAASQRQWNPQHIHFELFAAPTVTDGNTAFDVVLEQSGTHMTVPADKTLLQVLNTAGCDVMFDCERGECGVCAVEVISGDIDHRDYVLTSAEKAKGNLMHACVSRCRSKTLVLNL